MEKKIVLVGMPGSGKSTLGKDVARKFGYAFFDLDDCIEKEAGAKITTIFEKYGEGFFRKLETEVLNGLLQLDQAFVLATGGGAPCFNKNMRVINQYAISIYLDVPLNVILNRLTIGQVAKRPLFFGMDTSEIILKLKGMFEQRSPYYEKAKIKLSGEDISTELLISEWMAFLKVKP
ncbi:shikimate kinase [Pleomorphovibrio marinus]|uniref:shikimate kinase n=1 Tax=Pleomorphovibrio marinus TaxID=2164132 RepID=UPI000E0ACBCA|nr:shikimate kinase [Pleomorphovibrio marinus]